MRRQWHTTRRPDLHGTQEGVSKAMALAHSVDPETIESLLHIIGLLDRIGGQVYIAAYRNKYDRQTGELLEDVKQPGRYETDGYLFHYDHIAKLTRGDREPDADPDQPLENPLDLRDRIEEEVAAELDDQDAKAQPASEVEEED